MIGGLCSNPNAIKHLSVLLSLLGEIFIGVAQSKISKESIRDAEWGPISYDRGLERRRGVYFVASCWPVEGLLVGCITRAEGAVAVSRIP